MERPPMEQEKVLANHMSDKGLLPNIYEERTLPNLSQLLLILPIP